MKSSWWTRGVMLVALACAFIQAQAVTDAAFEPAFQLFTRALAGDDAAIDPAADAFGKLHAAEPTNPVLMAYDGAATTMKAKNALMPWKKMGYAEDGLALIDKALAMLAPAHDAPLARGTPGSLEVRFVAANTFLAVPDFMNRGARGATLLSDVIASPLFGRAPLGFRGQVWLRAATLATQQKHPDVARRYLEQVVASGAPQADRARALLKGLSA
ncbi:MAG: hypothetical protein JSR59_16320 [Proteobacteria bacterium]|nr:hypothetical protein [Pseudomonadota bacterium]